MNPIFVGAYPIVGATGMFFTKDPTFAIILISLIAVFRWFYLLKKKRVFDDTPTSKIAMAAQGFVEFQGKATNPLKEYYQTTYSKKNCVWYWSEKSEVVGSGKNAKTYIREREMFPRFLAIKDETGVCLIDPDEALFIGFNEEVTKDGRFTYIERWAEAGQSITTAGSLTTREKTPPKKLGNLIDPEKKWMAFKVKTNFPRSYALQQRQKEHLERLYAQTTESLVHFLVKPQSSKPFVVSGLKHDESAKSLNVEFYIQTALTIGAVAFMAFDVSMMIVRGGGILN